MFGRAARVAPTMTFAQRQAMMPRPFTPAFQGPQGMPFSTTPAQKVHFDKPETEAKFRQVVPPSRQQETMESFKGEIEHQESDQDKSMYRYVDEKTDPRGRFMTEDPTQTREDLAVLKKWNKMHFLLQLGMPPGTGSFVGDVGPQEDKATGEKYEGKGKQHYIPDTSKMSIENLLPSEGGIAAYGERDLRYGGYI